MRKQLRAISLFSGCGGLDLGIRRAGFKIELANDSEPLCAESFSRNFSTTPFYVGSVRDLKRTKLKEYVKEFEGIDLVFGGPPCPPFSKSRFYRKEKPRALNDPSGLETLTGYMELVELVMPKVFLLENVPGFAFKVHDEALKYVCEWASKHGYSLSRAVLDAANFGVAQHRERFFLIGSLHGNVKFPAATHGPPDESDLFAQPKLPWITAGEAISDLDTEENADDGGHYAGGAYHSLLEEVPPGDNYLFFTEKRGHPAPKFKWRSRYWSFLLKLNPSRPSWTIQARRSNNMGPFHWRNRILRIEEALRLQSFPDEFALAGKLDQQWRQVGNAVPPLLAEALGRAIRDHLTRES